MVLLGTPRFMNNNGSAAQDGRALLFVGGLAKGRTRLTRKPTKAHQRHFLREAGHVGGYVGCVLVGSAQGPSAACVVEL